MSAYFHSKSVGFYTDEVHGPRTILVVDPKWKQPEIKVTDPGWAPGDADEGAEGPLISVPDPDAVPPLIEVPNPKCSLPPKAELRDLPQDKYLELLVAQSQGKVIQANSKGEPVAVDPPLPNNDEMARRERLWCEREVRGTDSMVVLYRDELEAGRTTTLNREQYQELQAYRFALRDWPADANFPSKENRPATPGWLAGL
ncbi:phage tail protein [Pseudomonas sp. WS 5059]|uniref:phage tail protein n=1 Tax=Pseudomonas sp. WS 5059 TaxID=2717491 RepID=UPI0015B4044A|nr:phage tail protein [Pseudomonas sp. WS 5059]NMY01454.1 phage tail protein [Pseudomonas sp. WS 5059]